jgi:membrane protein
VTLINWFLSWFGTLLNTLFGISGSLEALTVVSYFGLITLSLALLYKVFPDVHIAWRDVWSGAFITALMIMLGGWLFGIFFKSGKIGSAFEAAGAVAIFLIGIYYIALIFLLRTVFIRVYSNTYGSKSPE